MQNQKIVANNATAQKILDLAAAKNLNESLKLIVPHKNKPDQETHLAVVAHTPSDIFKWGLLLGNIVSSGDCMTIIPTEDKKMLITLPEAKAQKRDPQTEPAPHRPTTPISQQENTTTTTLVDWDEYENTPANHPTTANTAKAEATITTTPTRISINVQGVDMPCLEVLIEISEKNPRLLAYLTDSSEDPVLSLKARKDAPILNFVRDTTENYDSPDILINAPYPQNTEFLFKYRDAENFKKTRRIVLEGRINPKTAQDMLTLDDFSGNGFDAEKLGISLKDFLPLETWDTTNDIDHSYLTLETAPTRDEPDCLDMETVHALGGNTAELVATTLLRAKND